MTPETFSGDAGSFSSSVSIPDSECVCVCLLSNPSLHAKPGCVSRYPKTLHHVGFGSSVYKSTKGFAHARHSRCSLTDSTVRSLPDRRDGVILDVPVFKQTAVRFPRKADPHARLRIDDAHAHRSCVGEQSRFTGRLEFELPHSRSVTAGHHVSPRWRNGSKRDP